MSKLVNLAVIGAGVVGLAFIRQLAALKTNVTFNVVYLARSLKEAVYNDDHSPINLNGYQLAAAKPVLSVSDLISFLTKANKPTILVDNTSNPQLADAYPQFVEAGISIATPNKKAFSSELSQWKKIFDASAKPGGGLVYHEATVGAGLPIIGPLKDMVLTGDKIQVVEGIFLGTLSYIFNEYSTTLPSQVKFSDIVAKAKLLGYTEPDPRDDLNGMDVARKVTIVGRIAGVPIELPTAFKVELLIPAPLESVSLAAEFLEKLPQYDDEMQKLKDEAFANNQVLRFVGKVDATTGEASVGIAKYGFDHPFAGLKGSDNVVLIKTDRYPNPLVVQGAGAGADVTAHGVLADTVRIAERIAQ